MTVENSAKKELRYYSQMQEREHIRLSNNNLPL